MLSYDIQGADLEMWQVEGSDFSTSAGHGEVNWGLGEASNFCHWVMFNEDLEILSS